MPSIPVDSPRLSLMATGKVSAVAEWRDGTRTGVQARHQDSGLPLWNVDVVDLSDGNDRATLMAIVIGAAEEPSLPPFAPLRVGGLVVNVYVDRAGRLATRWSADTITVTTAGPTPGTSPNAPTGPGEHRPGEGSGGRGLKAA